MLETKFAKFSAVALRLVLGWMFFYAGITEVVNPEWSAAGYLNTAKTFSGFYQWLASPAMLPITNFVNEWGLTLVGASLILGLFVRLGSFVGAGMMLLYYLPILDFPYPNTHSYIVDEHIIYVAAFLLLAALRAGRVVGLDKKFANSSWAAKCPKTVNFLS